MREVWQDAMRIVVMGVARCGGGEGDRRCGVKGLGDSYGGGSLQRTLTCTLASLQASMTVLVPSTLTL